MHYRSTWNLATIPDELLISERNRRISANRGAPPTPKILRPCPKCGHDFGARDLRLHIPRCPQTL